MDEIEEVVKKPKKIKKSHKKRCTLKRTKLRWNKKKGIREKSKKGSKDKVCVDDYSWNM